MFYKKHKRYNPTIESLDQQFQCPIMTYSMQRYIPQRLQLKSHISSSNFEFINVYHIVLCEHISTQFTKKVYKEIGEKNHLILIIIHAIQVQNIDQQLQNNVKFFSDKVYVRNDNENNITFLTLTKSPVTKELDHTYIPLLKSI